MIIRNAVVEGKRLNILIENGIIAALTDDPAEGGVDAGGKELIPGLIDIHTHGCGGHDVMDADFAPLCAYYAARGTTSFLPTTMTADHDSLLRVTEAGTDHPGAQVLGFHLEGPYVSQNKKGAQNGAYIRNPSLEEFSQFQGVKMITLAPELPGSMEFIRKVTPKTKAALGHTDCEYETALEAIANGADCLTHTFNAMPPLHHRKPGPIGAAVEKHIYAQIICDGYHVAKPVVLAAWRMFGPDRMILISDSLPCAGLPDGRYVSGGLPVTLGGGVARLLDGTLAGSSVMLLDCVKKAVEFGIPKADAIRMATRTPAEFLGVNKGRVAVGYDADLLLVDEELNLYAVVVSGMLVQY